MQNKTLHTEILTIHLQEAEKYPHIEAPQERNNIFQYLFLFFFYFFIIFI